MYNHNTTSNLISNCHKADKKPRKLTPAISNEKNGSRNYENPSCCSMVIQARSNFTSFDEVLKTTCEFIAVEEIIFAPDNPLIILEMMKEKCENS